MVTAAVDTAVTKQLQDVEGKCVKMIKGHEKRVDAEFVKLKEWQLEGVKKLNQLSNMLRGAGGRASAKRRGRSVECDWTIHNRHRFKPLKSGCEWQRIGGRFGVRARVVGLACKGLGLALTLESHCPQSALRVSTDQVGVTLEPLKVATHAALWRWDRWLRSYNNKHDCHKLELKGNSRPCFRQGSRCTLRARYK